MEVFLQWGIMLLGILGVVQLGELLSIWLRRPKKRPASFCVMPLHGSIGNVEQVLTYFRRSRCGVRRYSLPLSSTAVWRNTVPLPAKNGAIRKTA